MANKKPPSSPPDELPTGFGLDRESDIETLQWYLGRLASPDVMAHLVPRMTDAERLALGDTLAALLRKYFSETEYHQMIVHRTTASKC